MNSPISYIMFGHNRLVGDFTELIHACGGELHTVVQNIPEERIAGSPTLAERLPRIAAMQDGRMPRVIWLDDFAPLEDALYLIGFTGYRMQPLLEQLNGKFSLSFSKLVHPSAVMATSACISDGCCVNAGAVIASNAYLGEHVFINRAASIGHDTHIGRFSVVQPGANLAGHVTVGEGALIGIGATVIEDRSIGHHAVVAAGAVVTRDVEPGVMVAGVPAVPKKTVFSF
jgi:sugar O-acyltransferase (sialic acid O-acetyltransferase NeuD family)